MREKKERLVGRKAEDYEGQMNVSVLVRENKAEKRKKPLGLPM